MKLNKYICKCFRGYAIQVCWYLSLCPRWCTGGQGFSWQRLTNITKTVMTCRMVLPGLCWVMWLSIRSVSGIELVGGVFFRHEEQLQIAQLNPEVSQRFSPQSLHVSQLLSLHQSVLVHLRQVLTSVGSLLRRYILADVVSLSSPGQCLNGGSIYLDPGSCRDRWGSTSRRVLQLFNA